MILLDSDVIIDLLRKNQSRSEEITEKIAYSGENDIRISSIALEEVLYGIIKHKTFYMTKSVMYSENRVCQGFVDLTR